MIGRVHSFQSLGAVDGPGIRFVVFLQGCNLRCKCCHNPDTWDTFKGEEYTAEQVFSKVINYREYFGDRGGITLSGGEPLLQSKFATELFTLCKESGIDTCLDTSGSIINEDVLALINVTNRVLLDIKYTSDKEYLNNVGCSLNTVLEFLKVLEQKQIPTVLRQVIIPDVNNNDKNIIALKNIKAQHTCVEKIELLPFKKLAQIKYDNMGIEFPFGHLLEPTEQEMEYLNSLL